MRLKCHEILEILATYHNTYMVKKKQVEVFTGNHNTYSPDDVRGRGFTMNERSGFLEKPVGRAGQVFAPKEKTKSKQGPEIYSEVIEVECMTPARILLA